MKNLDANGRVIRHGDRIKFDGSKLMGQAWIEYGCLQYDRSRNKWLFVPDVGDPHGAVIDYQPGGKRIFKYYTVIKEYMKL